MCAKGPPPPTCGHNDGSTHLSKMAAQRCHRDSLTRVCRRHLLQHLQRGLLHIELIGVVLREPPHPQLVVELDVPCGGSMVAEDRLRTKQKTLTVVQ